MGYRIEYDRLGGRYEVVRHYPGRFPLLLAGAFALFVLFTMLCWPAGAELLRELSIPGDNAVTAGAFQMMTDDLRCGASFEGALTTFCREVYNGAKGAD